ncbi:MAG: hypothetical protein V2I36_10005 [Desulfopila sp.]|nr:hypothetical protein [Desulfopila sp.]
MNKKNKKFLGKFVDLKKFENKQYRKENEFDATKPSVLLWLTICYVLIVCFLIIGIPWQGVGPTPIPSEDLPIAIPIFIILYIVVIGGLYLRDRFKKK